LKKRINFQYFVLICLKSNFFYHKTLKRNDIGKLQQLFSQFNSSSEDDNLIISPFSISTVLAMVLAGAKGSTADQIRAGLKLPSDEHLLAGR
jgi:serine protease inhibitor